MVQREKRVEFKFMKEMKVCYYSSMPEMVAELNAKIPAEPKTINLHLDGFDIRCDYNSFSNNSTVIISHGVSIKIYGSDLAMRLGFKKNEILRGPTPIVSIYTALYIYTDIIQKQLVGDLGAPEKSRYGDTTCVTNELF